MSKLHVFISWSGERSRKIAALLRDWLPDVVKDADPWLSNEDLRKGLQWLPELNKQLAPSSMGLLVVTSDNKDAPWLVFETGVLWKAMADKHCCPILCDLGPTELSGPLASFQATSLTRDDMYRLVQTMNAACGDSCVDEARLKKWFDQNWEALERDIRGVLTSSREALSSARLPSERQLLEEILTTVRSLAREPMESSRDSLRLFAPLREVLSNFSPRDQERAYLYLKQAFASPKDDHLLQGLLIEDASPVEFSKLFDHLISSGMSRDQATREAHRILASRGTDPRRRARE